MTAYSQYSVIKNIQKNQFDIDIYIYIYNLTLSIIWYNIYKPGQVYHVYIGEGGGCVLRT